MIYIHQFDKESPINFPVQALSWVLTYWSHRESLGYFRLWFWRMNSSKSLRRMRMFKIHKIPLSKNHSYYLEMSLSYHFTFSIIVNQRKNKPYQQFLNDGPSSLLVVWFRDTNLGASAPYYMFFPTTPINRAFYGPRHVICLSRLVSGLGLFCSNKGSFLKRPWMVLGDFLSNISN